MKKASTLPDGHASIEGERSIPPSFFTIPSGSEVESFFIKTHNDEKAPFLFLYCCRTDPMGVNALSDSQSDIEERHSVTHRRTTTQSPGRWAALRI